MKTTVRVFVGFGALVALSACTTISHRREQQAEAPVPIAAPEQTTAPSLKEELTGKPDAPVAAAETVTAVPATIPESMKATGPSESNDDMQVTLKKNGKEVAASAPKNPIAPSEPLPDGMTPQAADLPIEPGGPLPPQSSHAPLAADLATKTTAAPGRGEVSAEKALNWLKNGNRRFAKGFLRKDGQSMKDVRRLAAGAKPHTIILASSDSRMPPEIVFDQKLGEIEVIRTFGPSVDQSVVASVEHAVSSTGSNLILVLAPGSDEWDVVKSAARELEDKSDVVRGAVSAGLQIKTAIYDLSSGTVSFK